MLHASLFQVPGSGASRTGATRSRRPKPLDSLAARRHSFVPRLESLEDRTLPSGGYVFRTIDPSQAANGSAATLINSSGKIVGFYLDANFVQHGYLLSGGQYTTIDDPNAGTSAGQGTFAAGINASGDIGGAYTDANFVQHGFLLSGGQYTTIDEPDAGTGAGQGTLSVISNASGTIVGAYMDANSVQHGYLLSGGQFTTIDDPNAGTGPSQGTNAQGISAAGVIVGYYFDANSVGHGFLLSGGQFTTIDDPAAALGTGALALNDHGQVSGVYVDTTPRPHGFLLSGGQFTTFDDPAGVLGSAADSINNSGNVVGVYTDANGVIHGYLATRAHGNSAMGSQRPAGGRGSMNTLDAFHSVDWTAPDRLPPAQGTLSSPGSAPAVQGKPDRLPMQAEGSRIDPGSIDDRWNTAHPSTQLSKTALEGLPMDGLHDELATDFAAHV
jgi:hypothetical protein